MFLLFLFDCFFLKLVFMFYFLKVSVFKYNNIDIYCKFIGKKSVESDVSINIFSKIWFYEKFKIDVLFLEDVF